MKTKSCLPTILILVLLALVGSWLWRTGTPTIPLSEYIPREGSRGPVQEYRDLLASHGSIELDDLLEELPILNIGAPTTLDKLLEPHLAIVLNSMPADRRSELGEVYAGIFPGKKPNARVLRASNGGVLIIVNQGMVTALYSWAQGLTDVAFLAGSDSPDAAEKLDQVYSAFQDSHKRYRETQTVSPLRYTAAHETKVFASSITWSAIWFVLAHECAHALRNEIDATLTGRASDRWGYEVPVDQLAMQLFMPKPTDPKYEVKLAGTTYALGMLTVLESGLTDAALDGTFRNMDLAMQWIVQSTGAASDNYTIVRLIRVGLAKFRNVVKHGYVRSSQLGPAELAKRLFWTAHMVQNTDKQQHLVAEDPEGYRFWAVVLRKKAGSLDETKKQFNKELGDNMFSMKGIVTYPKWAYSEEFDSERLIVLAKAVEKALNTMPRERLPAKERRWPQAEWEIEDSEEIGMPTPIYNALAAEDHAQQAMRFIRAGELQNALEQQNAAIRLNPDRASFYHNRGVILAMQNRCEEAILDFEKAISISETSIETHVGLADCLMQIGHIDRANTMLTRAIKLSKLADAGDFAPESAAMLHLFRFNTLLAQNKDEEAMRDFMIAARILSEPMVAKAFVEAEKAGVMQLPTANYLALSMQLWTEKQYEACLVISERLLTLAAEDPDFSAVETKKIAQSIQNLKTLLMK